MFYRVELKLLSSETNNKSSSDGDKAKQRNKNETQNWIRIFAKAEIKTSPIIVVDRYVAEIVFDSLRQNKRRNTGNIPLREPNGIDVSQTDWFIAIYFVLFIIESL